MAKRNSNCSPGGSSSTWKSADNEITLFPHVPRGCSGYLSTVGFESLWGKTPRIWLAFNQIFMITSLVYSPRVMQTFLWVSKLGELRKVALYHVPCFYRWNVSLLALQVGITATVTCWGGDNKAQAESAEDPGNIWVVVVLGRALHSIQGFWWLWVCWGVPITASLEEFDWCVIMRWDVSQPGNEEREGSPGESHFYNRLEATESKISFINCRMNREERKAGLGLEWPHRPCSRV